MMLRPAAQRLTIPVAQGVPHRRLLSDSTALSHYKRERLLAKIGFGIHNSRRDARRLRLGALRALASPRARTTHLTVLHRAYGVLEACLDAQVAALDKAPAPEGELEDFSSLQGVAAQFWQEHGDGLRRAPALAAALKADRPEVVELGEELYAEEHYWSPGTLQFARRVRAVEALNGDLLLGHILGAHIGDMAFDASIGYSADERRLGYTPSRSANAPPVQEVLAAIDAAAEELLREQLRRQRRAAILQVLALCLGRIKLTRRQMHAANSHMQFIVLRRKFRRAAVDRDRIGVLAP